MGDKRAGSDSGSNGGPAGGGELPPRGITEPDELAPASGGAGVNDLASSGAGTSASGAGGEKRGRGRPRKDGAQANAAPGMAPASASVTTPQAPRPAAARSHKAGAGKQAREAAAQADAQAGAAAIMAMAEGMVTAAFGPEAAPNDTERFLINGSLPQMLAAMEPETVRKVQAVTFPLMLMAGLGAWGFRVYMLTRPRGDDGGGASSSPVVTPPPPDGAQAPIPEMSDPERRADAEPSPWGKRDARANIAGDLRPYV